VIPPPQNRLPLIGLRLVATICWLACSLAPAQTEVHPEELQLKSQIDQAIEKGVESIIDRQYRNGSWGLHGNDVGGRAGLTLYTLLQCGVSRNHPCVKRAVSYLDTVDPQRTYSTTCMILAIDALREGRDERIEELVAKLLDWQRPQGDWAYPQGNADLSCTQYAALGLWVAKKRGIKIDRECWLDLLDACENYQGETKKIANKVAEGRTGATKILSTGYSYRPLRSNANQKQTGSMTAAAITVFEVCKAGLGRQMSRSLRRKTDNHIEEAINWLAQNFSATTNPNGGHHYYYMYGLERIGALTRLEQFGPHWWYLDGAKHLISTQNKTTGAWGQIHETCFALLFLRKATRGHAPTTGGAGKNKHVFAVGEKSEDADVRLRAAGQQPLSLWIDGFGDSLKELHSDYGLRIISVDYIDEAGNCLAKISGDPTKTWRKETFLHRDKAISRGSHKVKARITVLANDVAPDEESEGKVEVIESELMEIAIRDVIEPWMNETNEIYKKNLLRDLEPKIFASSSKNKQRQETNLIDGQDSKAWIASPDDKSPTVTFSWKKTARVAKIAFAHPAQHDDQLSKFDDFGSIEVLIGNDKDRWLTITAGKDRLAPTVFELPRPRKMRKIEIRFAGRVHKNGDIGLAEFILLPPEQKVRRPR
jgi:hypothetical protein